MVRGVAKKAVSKIGSVKNGTKKVARNTIGVVFKRLMETRFMQHFDRGISKSLTARKVEHRFWMAFVSFFAFECCLWAGWTNKIKVDFTITPLPPSKLEMDLFSMGDKELLYRIYSFKLQNAGDTFGETTPLKDYDYEKLEKWFYALSELDPRSEWVPSIAGFYYSASQNADDNRYIVNYLLDFAEKDPEKHWRWYVTSAYIAKHKLNDPTLAFNMAKRLLNLKSDKLPFINRIMALFLFSEKEAKSCRAVNLVYNLIQSGDLEAVLSDKFFSAKEGMYNYLFGLVRERVDNIVKDKALIRKCQAQHEIYND